MRKVKDLLEILKSKDQNKEISFIPSSTTGTEIFSGEFFEDYLDEIRGKEWSIKADKMRRSCDQITMLLSLIKNPIVSGTWEIEVPDEVANSQEIKEFLEFAIFQNIDFTQFIREALTFFEFGHSVFEPVYQPLISHPKYRGSIVLKKLSYISPKTIERWHVRKYAGLTGIQQQAYGDLDSDIVIPERNLLHFAIGKEGDNYEGRSLLRPIYGNWKRKQAFLKVNALGVERASLGVPVGVTAPGASDKAQSNLKAILAAVTSYQRASIVVPHGTDIKNFEIGFDADKVLNAVAAERLGMSQSFLAGFMELGNNSGSGSFALSSNLMNIFLSSIQAYADVITHSFNKKIIKNLVDANFGKMTEYPKLKVSNISDKLGKEFTEILTMLTQSGYVAPTEAMKEYLKKKFNLPEEEIEEDTTVEEPEVEEVEEKPIEEKSDFIELAQKSTATKQIDIEKKELQEIMMTELFKRRDKLLASSRKILDNNQTKTRRQEVINQNIPDVVKYKRIIADFLIESSARATTQAKKETGTSNIELADKKDVNKLTSDTKSRIRSEVDLIVDTQDSDLRKNLFFVFNNNLDNTDSIDLLISEMKVSSDKFIEGPSISVGAANFVSNSVNNGRNDVFQTKEVMDEIESFTITNPSPTAAICKELAGRTITKEEYINGDLPPYHHNCNTIVVANVANASNNPQINPLGLSFTGSKEEVEKIIKSRTF